MEFVESKDVAPSPKKKLSRTATTLIALTGGIGVGITVVCASFVAPAFRKYCLPYVPATNQQISNVLSVLPRNIQGKLLDIGSGDGRIVLGEMLLLYKSCISLTQSLAAAANHGVESHGVELNTWLVLYSKLVGLKTKTAKPTKFFKRDLWKFDIKPYDYIVIFGVEQMMKDLEHKLIAESKENSKIIACRFPLPNSEPVTVIGDGVDTVWLYDLKSNK